MNPLAVTVTVLWGVYLALSIVREVKTVQIVRRTDRELKRRGYKP